jgi:hypothetical protein
MLKEFADYLHGLAKSKLDAEITPRHIPGDAPGRVWLDKTEFRTLPPNLDEVHLTLDSFIDRLKHRLQNGDPAEWPKYVSVDSSGAKTYVDYDPRWGGITFPLSYTDAALWLRSHKKVAITHHHLVTELLTTFNGMVAEDDVARLEAIKVVKTDEGTSIKSQSSVGVSASFRAETDPTLKLPKHLVFEFPMFDELTDWERSEVTYLLEFNPEHAMFVLHPLAGEWEAAVQHVLLQLQRHLENALPDEVLVSCATTTPAW